MRFVYTLASLIFSLATFANVTDSLRTEQREEGLFIVHQVDEQETLYSISKRYRGDVNQIIKYNHIIDNRIDIGQIIYVFAPVKGDVSQDILVDTKKIHWIKPGETLYSLAKQYDVKIKNLRKWNDLPDDAISPNMPLKLSKSAVIPSSIEDVDSVNSYEEIEEDSVFIEEEDSLYGFTEYLVQTGETLSTIARKTGVPMDSLKIWNGLNSDFLQIGQSLYFKAPDEETLNEAQKKQTQIDDKGFERIYEEGMSSVIQSMKTTKYLALHRSLPIGINLEVRNLMNNRIVYVKVVGRLPDTGLNKKLLLRISKPAYDQLGILDSKSRVEVSYDKE